MNPKALLITDGIIHPPLLGRVALRRALAALAGFAWEQARSLEVLPSRPRNYAALVLYFHHARISERALEALEQFVAGGGGVLAIHSATASFKETPAYFDILGGKFVGHGPVEHFEVRPVPESGLFGDIPPFTVRDELYRHELRPGIQAHLVAVERGEEVPVLWTYRYGQGRVCYAVPGHCAATMRHPTYQEVLRRGLLWVCGREEG